MKRLTIIYIALLTLSAMQCKKKEQTIYDLKAEQNTGVFTAKLNGSPWSANAVEATLHTDRPDEFFVFADIVQNGWVAQHLSLASIALNNSKQRLYSPTRWIVFERSGKPRGPDTATGVFFLKNTDYVENDYYIADNEDIFFQLEGYSKSSPVLKGKFQLTLYRLYKEYKRQTHGLPDTLRFIDGEFYMQLTAERQ